MWNTPKKKICGIQPVILNMKNSNKMKAYICFWNLIDFMRHSFVLNCSDFSSNMHSNIYSCLFRAANIKQENIIDLHVAWTEVNVVTSLQIKECKTHLLFVSDLKIDRRMRLCVIVKSTKLFGIIGWLASSCVQWIDLKTVKYYFQAFFP